MPRQIFPISENKVYNAKNTIADETRTPTAYCTFLRLLDLLQVTRHPSNNYLNILCYTYTYITICIYIYREREREKERYVYICIYIYG